MDLPIRRRLTTAHYSSMHLNTEVARIRSLLNGMNRVEMRLQWQNGAGRWVDEHGFVSLSHSGSLMWTDIDDATVNVDWPANVPYSNFAVLSVGEAATHAFNQVSDIAADVGQLAQIATAQLHEQREEHFSQYRAAQDEIQSQRSDLQQQRNALNATEVQLQDMRNELQAEYEQVQQARYDTDSARAAALKASEKAQRELEDLRSAHQEKVLDLQAQVTRFNVTREAARTADMDSLRASLAAIQPRVTPVQQAVRTIPHGLPPAPVNGARGDASLHQPASQMTPAVPATHRQQQDVVSTTTAVPLRMFDVTSWVSEVDGGATSKGFLLLKLRAHYDVNGSSSLMKRTAMDLLEGWVDLMATLDSWPDSPAATALGTKLLTLLREQHHMEKGFTFAEVRQQTEKVDLEDDTLGQLLTKVEKQKKATSGKTLAKKSCNYCGKENHVASKCRLRIAQETPKNTKGGPLK